MLQCGISALAYYNKLKLGEYPHAVLYFHRVLDKPTSFCPDDLDKVAFKQLIARLNQYFDILPLQTAIERQGTTQWRKNSLSLSFDDGYADNYRNALPILDEFGIKASFFVATQGTQLGYLWNDAIEFNIRATMRNSVSFMGKVLPTRTEEQKAKAYLTIVKNTKLLPNQKRDDIINDIVSQCGHHSTKRCMMTADELKELANEGHDVGAHTVTHSILGAQSRAVAKQEIEDSIQYLGGLLNKQTALFAYPNGRPGRDFNDEHGNMVLNSGAKYAFSTEDAGITTKTNKTALPRFMPYRKEMNQFCLSIEKIAGD